MMAVIQIAKKKQDGNVLTLLEHLQVSEHQYVEMASLSLLKNMMMVIQPPTMVVILTVTLKMAGTELILIAHLQVYVLFYVEMEY